MNARTLPLVTVALAIVTAAVFVVLPVYRSESCSASSAGPMTCASSTSTLLAHEGAGVLLALLIPAAIAAIGVAVPIRAVLFVVAALLTVGVVLSAASIGIFFVPAMLSAWIAAGRTPPRREAPLY